MRSFEKTGLVFGTPTCYEGSARYPHCREGTRLVELVETIRHLLQQFVLAEEPYSLRVDQQCRYDRTAKSNPAVIRLHLVSALPLGLVEQGR